MELNVMERMILLNMLPAEENIMTLRLIGNLKGDLSFDDDEHKALDFIQEGEQLRWNAEADVVKDVTVSEVMTNLIVDILKKLDEEKKLTEAHISLWDKFITK